MSCISYLAMMKFNVTDKIIGLATCENLLSLISEIYCHIIYWFIFWVSCNLDNIWILSYSCPMGTWIYHATDKFWKAGKNDWASTLQLQFALCLHALTWILEQKQAVKLKFRARHNTVIHVGVRYKFHISLFHRDLARNK